MSQNKIKFVNLKRQMADATMIMSLLNNAKLGAILKTECGEYFYIVETREKTTSNEYTSVFSGFTIEKEVDGKIKHTAITRASTDEIFVNGEPDTFYLATILVEEHYRNRGIGSCVLQYLQSLAATRGYKTFRLNATARIDDDRDYPYTTVDVNELFYMKNGYIPIEFKSKERSMTKFERIVRESDKKKDKTTAFENDILDAFVQE